MHETTNKPLFRLALVPLAVLAGCLSGQSAITIQGFTAVEAAGGVCVPGTTTLVQGLMDTTRTLGTASRAYFVGVSLTNAMPSNEDLEAGRADSNTVYLDAMNVSYRTSQNATFAAPPSETIPVSIVLPSGNGSATAAVPLVLSTTTEQLGGASGGFLIAEVTFTGRTQDGGAVFATPVEFPIELCDGCLGAACGTGEQVAGLCSIAQNEGLVCETADTP